MIPRRCYGCHRIRWRTKKCPDCARRICRECAEPKQHTRPVLMAFDYAPTGTFDIPKRRSRCERWKLLP